MKILSPGTNKEWSRECECTGIGNGVGGCGARLLVEADDLYRTSFLYRDGSVDTCITFCCPQCGTQTDIDKSYVPTHVKPFKDRESMLIAKGDKK